MRPRFRLRISRGAEELPPFGGDHGLPLANIFTSPVAELAASITSGVGVLDELGRTIVGRAYRKNGGPASLPDVLTGELLSRHLITDLWGMFLVVEVPRDRGPVRVTRDASSYLPVYYLERPSEVIIASDMECLGVDASSAEIDWAAVATHLRSDTLRRRQTCLSGVSELLPGEALVVEDAGVVIEPIWSPWTFTDRAHQITNYDVAVEELRGVLKATTSALVHGYRRAVIGVSGGLDSSIVAALLREARLEVSALTLATHAPGGDERHYSRILSDSLGIGLVEALEDVAQVDVLRSDAAHLPRPLARSFAQWGNRRHLELAQDVGADVFFNGAGGDNVFCALHSVSMLADHLLARPGPGVLRTAHDLALMGDVPLISVLRRGVQRARRKPHNYRWPLQNAFLTDHCRRSTVFEHPWLKTRPAETLPGKSAHVAWLMGIQNHLEGFSHERVLPILSPLVAQPVQELCLRIPTWFWCKGGRNRAVARDAMADLLPPSILTRSTKGTPSTFVLALMRTNTEEIREMLNYGLLAQHGFVDTGAVNACLDCPDDPEPAIYARMMALVDVEAWLQSWRG